MGGWLCTGRASPLFLGCWLRRDVRGAAAAGPAAAGVALGRGPLRFAIDDVLDLGLIGRRQLALDRVENRAVLRAGRLGESLRGLALFFIARGAEATGRVAE